MADAVTFHLAEDDAIAANRLTAVASLRTPTPYLRIGTLAAVAVIFMEWLTWDQYTGIAHLVVAALTVIYVVVLIALFIAINLALLPRRTRRLFRQTRVIGGETTAGWDDEALCFTSAVSDNRYAWRHLHHWLCGRGVSAFYLNDQLYHVIPDRALTPAQRDDLHRTAGKRLGPPGAAVAARKLPA